VSTGGIVIIAIVIVVVGLVAYLKIADQKRLDQMTPEARDKELARREASHKETAAFAKYGAKNLALVCPHCQVKGMVRAQPITQKKGISGGKATAAVLTAGLSVVATGLSRKEHNTQAHCDNCGSTWTF
jgi:hypothetical protein